MPEFARRDLYGVRQREAGEVRVTCRVVKAEQAGGMRAPDVLLHGFEEDRQLLVAPLPVNSIITDVEVHFVEVDLRDIIAWHWLLHPKDRSAVILPALLTIMT